MSVILLIFLFLVIKWVIDSRHDHAEVESEYVNVFERLSELIDRSSIMHLGTCSPEGIPLSTRVVGGYVVAPDRQIAVYIPQKNADRILRHLEQNPKLALLFIDPHTYQSLQVKGLLENISESTERDYRLQDLYFLRMRRHSLPEGFYNIHRKPALTLRMTITDVYDQTPGPNAGKLMNAIREEE